MKLIYNLKKDIFEMMYKNESDKIEEIDEILVPIINFKYQEASISRTISAKVYFQEAIIRIC